MYLYASTPLYQDTIGPFALDINLARKKRPILTERPNGFGIKKLTAGEDTA